jgi:hypothetical protein
MIKLLKDVPAEIPGTTVHFLRCGFNSGLLPGFRIGDPVTGRIAFDIDILKRHLENMALNNVKPAPDAGYGKLRAVK